MRDRSEKSSELVNRLIELMERSKARKRDLQRPKTIARAKIKATEPARRLHA